MAGYRERYITLISNCGAYVTLTSNRKIKGRFRNWKDSKEIHTQQ